MAGESHILFISLHLCASLSFSFFSILFFFLLFFQQTPALIIFEHVCVLNSAPRGSFALITMYYTCRESWKPCAIIPARENTCPTVSLPQRMIPSNVASCSLSPCTHAYAPARSGSRKMYGLKKNNITTRTTRRAEKRNTRQKMQPTKIWMRTVKRWTRRRITKKNIQMRMKFCRNIKEDGEKSIT